MTKSYLDKEETLWLMLQKTQKHCGEWETDPARCLGPWYTHTFSQLLQQTTI